MKTDEEMLRELIAATKEQEYLNAAADVQRTLNSLRGAQPAEDMIGKMPYRNDSRPGFQERDGAPSWFDLKPSSGRYIRKP